MYLRFINNHKHKAFQSMLHESFSLCICKNTKIKKKKA